MLDEIPHKRFKAEDGRTWTVWQVEPDDRAMEYLREGWLCFESEEERRRFAPIPHGWENMGDAVLRVLLSVSAPAQRPK